MGGTYFQPLWANHVRSVHDLIPEDLNITPPEDVIQEPEKRAVEDKRMQKQMEAEERRRKVDEGNKAKGEARKKEKEKERQKAKKVSQVLRTN